MDRDTAAMHDVGKISVYSGAGRSGLIKTSKGTLLYFSLGEWRSQGTEPQPGQAVKFTHGYYAASNVEIIVPGEKSG
jgi:hypothetical protein